MIIKISSRRRTILLLYVALFTVLKGNELKFKGKQHTPYSLILVLSCAQIKCSHIVYKRQV